MIEHLMSSSLSGDYKGCAAGFIRLHVRGLRSQWPPCSCDLQQEFGIQTHKPSRWIPTRNLAGHLSDFANLSGRDSSTTGRLNSNASFTLVETNSSLRKRIDKS